MKKKIIISLLLVCSLLISCTSYSNEETLSLNEVISVEEELLTSPGTEIQEPKEDEDSSFYSIDTIISSIDSLAKDYKDNMALYYYNFDTKDEYYFNEDTYFISASLKKIPLVMQVLDKVQNGELTLDTEITYDHSTDYTNGTGTLQFEEYIGSRPISELIELSILESDNIAYNMLNKLSNYTLIEYIQELVDDYTIPDEDYTRLTAKHNFKILYNLYENPNNNPYYPTVIELLKRTAFHDRFDKYIPHDEVAHKIGSYFRYYHDAGIIFGEETYILVILTKDIGELSDDPQFQENDEERIVIDWGEEACDLIGRISKTIYDITKTGQVSSEELVEYEPIIDPKITTNESYGLLKPIVE